MRKRWSGMLLLSAVVLVSACQRPEQKMHPRARLVATPRPFESDIPVPSGFRLMDNMSEDYRLSGKRLYLRHRYVGFAPKIAVRTFYRDQMPLARWTPLRDDSLRGRYTMEFQKGQDFCTITIEQTEPTPHGDVIVDVRVAPSLGDSKTVRKLP